MKAAYLYGSCVTLPSDAHLSSEGIAEMARLTLQSAGLEDYTDQIVISDMVVCDAKA